MRLCRFTVTCLCLAIAVVAGCKRTTGRNGVITAPGVFGSPDGKHALTVTLTPNKTVNYVISDAATGKELARGDAGSTYQRWFFFWDPGGQTLWVHSSDIGGCAWTVEGGSWTQHPLTKDGPLVKRMPAAVRESLPPTLRKEFGL